MKPILIIIILTLMLGACRDKPKQKGGTVIINGQVNDISWNTLQNKLKASTDSVVYYYPLELVDTVKKK